MTSNYVPEDGDEVEVEVVLMPGRVERVSGGFYLRTPGTLSFIAKPHVVSVTRVTPALPTTLDSKVDATDQNGQRREWVLLTSVANGEGGWWAALDSSLGALGNTLTVHSVLRVGGAS